MKKFLRKTFFLLPVFLLFLAFFPNVTAQAAQTPAKIKTCKLVSSKKLRVTASISSPKSIQGQKVYLFSLPLATSKIPAKAKPLASKKAAKSVSFTVNVSASRQSSLLYSHFVLARRKSNGKYSVISNTKYISNPKKLAMYKYSFPKAVSKKGLQVSASMLEDAVELNVRHSVLNIVFTDLIATKSESNTGSSIPYKYQGKTYWFRKGTVNSYDTQLLALKENDAVISAVLLLAWRDDLTGLIYPSGRVSGHSFYAWNTKTSSARKQLQATISFLAERYSGADAKYGRIVNWIVGNEVNNYKVYNYAGQKSLKTYAKIYAQAFRLTYNAVTSVYANARVYISLDHLWNTNTVNGTFASRKMLDAFASALKSGGSIRWNLAYHPYSCPLTEPKFWKNTNGQLTDSLTSPVINMGNINILTSYIRRKYGKNTRIILSEQGYTSSQAKVSTAKAQAAAIAYSYLLTESDSMIDSFIMNRQVDHQAEVAQGLSLGLWTTDASSGSPEDADNKKQSWNVFKYMDTNLSETVTNSSLSVIGIKKWTDVIPNYSSALYNKTSITNATLAQVEGYTASASIPAGWKLYGAGSKLSSKKGMLTVTHNKNRNKNSLWGFSQEFSGKLSFAEHPFLFTTLRVKGATSGKATVKIRFYSGKRILECSRVIPANGTYVNLGVSLANWKYRDSVTKIRIMITRSGGKWDSNASVTMTPPVRGK